MRKTPWKVLVIAAILGLFGFLFLWWWVAPRHSINGASWRRISEGMTESQLVEIFGVPPGDYTTVLEDGPEIGQGFIEVPGSKKVLVPFQYPKKDGVKQTVNQHVLDLEDLQLTYQEWKADKCSIFVYLKNGKVFFHGIGGVDHDETLFQRIRGFIGL